MRRPIAALLVVTMIAALVVPAVAFANNGRGNSESNSRGSRDKSAVLTHVADKAAARASHKAAQKAAKVARKAAATARSAESRAAWATRKSAAVAARTARKAAREASRSVEPTGSLETTRAVGPGVSNAFARITANMEKSIAKMAAGTKKQMPAGLIRVWLKFAGWLGVEAR